MLFFDGMLDFFFYVYLQLFIVCIFISVELWKLSTVEHLMQGQVYGVKGLNVKEIDFDACSTIRN